MKHGTLILPAEKARYYIELLGRKVQLQIEDMNHTSMKRNYRKYIQRVEDIERSIRFIQEEISRSGVVGGAKVVNDRIDSFLDSAEGYKLDQVEAEVKELYHQFQSFRTNNSDMLTQRNAAIEEKYVAYAASLQLRGRSESTRLLDDTGTTVFSNLAGVILQADQERFARTIFRAARGNAFTEFNLIPEPLRDTSTGQDTLKSVFVIYYQGGSGSAMHEKISRICHSFSAALYAWPRSETEALSQITQADQMMEDKKAAMVAYEKFLTDEATYLHKLVRDGTGNSLIEEWTLWCRREKSLYATLNLFEGETTLRADCWFPENEEEEIKRLLGSVGGRGVTATLLPGQPRPGAVVPTYIKSNAVISSFQLIVDTYGVPRYKEANPALFAIVSFPFLFGIMFGDIGHGFLLLMVGVWVLFQRRQLEQVKSGIMAQLFAHRFLILAMGAFAVYAGVMYTEFFAIGVNFFGSKWSCPDDGTGRHSVECEPLNGAGEGPYPVGLDPAWSIASNQLLFVNSMKMKISVLFGVAQMLLGVGLKFANSVYFRNKTDFLFECIPQLAFMLALFAYMDWMIMYKWVTPMAAPPGLIDTMITLGLTGGDVRQELYAGQAAVQAVLFKIGIWSVPLMLIPKPLILWLQHRFGRGSGYSSVHAEDDTVGLISGGGGHTGGHAGSGGHGGAGHGGVGHDKEEFEIGEIAIHQAIETIEFVLGTVSHTASYLRLWALSLAHQQLSLVFLKKTLFASLNMLPVVLNGISIYIGFGAFLVVTAGILLGMDVMECFLHTLRLHWVEFQSKFYKADGIKFRPFSHRSNVADVETSP